MKKFIRILSLLALAGLVAYALYLLYTKLISQSDNDQWDDLEDWGYEFEDEKQPEITFTERVRAAADRHLKKAR